MSQQESKRHECPVCDKSYKRYHRMIEHYGEEHADDVAELLHE